MYLKAAENVNFDTEDKLSFLNNFSKNHISLLAYTMHSNSFMFVLKVLSGSLENVLRNTTIKFAKSYNAAYNRKGKVFTGRYASVPAKNDEEVLNFIVDVHSAALCSRDVITSKSDYFTNKFIDNDYITKTYSKQNIDTIVYNKAGSLKQTIKMSDEEVSNYIINNFKIKPENLSKISKNVLDNVLSHIFSTTKASVRQVARITSLPLRMLWSFAKGLKLNGVSDKQKAKNENKV